MKGRLRYVPDYKCRECTGEIRSLEGLPAESVVTSNKSLEIVNKFCYLGDMISAAGGVGESMVARIRCGWEKFRELLFCLPPKVFSLHTKDNIFQT